MCAYLLVDDAGLRVGHLRTAQGVPSSLQASLCGIQLATLRPLGKATRKDSGPSPKPGRSSLEATHSSAETAALASVGPLA